MVVVDSSGAFRAGQVGCALRASSSSDVLSTDRFFGSCGEWSEQQEQAGCVLGMLRAFLVPFVHDAVQL